MYKLIHRLYSNDMSFLQARLSPNLEVYAQFSKPDGVRDGSMPYTAWKSTPLSQGSSTGKKQQPDYQLSDDMLVYY